MVKPIYFLFFFIWLGLSCAATVETNLSLPQENKEPNNPKADKTLPTSWDMESVAYLINLRSEQITECYNQIKLKKSSLSGSLVVRFQILPTGRVDSFRVTEDRIQDNQLNHCLKTTILSWKFSEVDSSVHALWIEVPYDFEDFTGNELSYRDENECFDKINIYKNQLSSCLLNFEENFETGIEIEILPSGKINNVVFYNTSDKDRDVTDCLKQKILTWVFPSITGDRNQKLKFSYIYSR